MVGAALGKAAVSARLMTATMPKALSSDPAENGVDLFTGARLERDRRAAADRYMRDRDVLQLQATMARLDAEERQAEDRGSSEVTPEKARHYLENLSELWNETEPEGQRAIAESAIDHIEAVGLDLVCQRPCRSPRFRP